MYLRGIAIAMMGILRYQADMITAMTAVLSQSQRFVLAAEEVYTVHVTIITN